MKTTIYIILGFLTTLAIFVGLAFIFSGLRGETRKSSQKSAPQNTITTNTTNPPVQIGKLPDINSEANSLSWGESIQYVILTPVFNNEKIVIINSGGKTEIKTISAENEVTVLYSISETVSKLNVYNTFEISYLTTNFPLSQKLIARGENFISEIKLPTDKELLTYYFYPTERVFYFLMQNLDSETELYYSFLNSEPFFITKVSGLSKNTEIISVDSTKITFEVINSLPGNECKSFLFATKRLVQENCESFQKTKLAKTDSGFNIFNNGEILEVEVLDKVLILKENSEDSFVLVTETEEAYVLELRDYTNSVLSVKELPKETLDSIPDFEDIVYFNGEWEY
ncbi:MAG: hypothetical protein Kow0081_4480 [Candidatus Dojkabacteria bacterium]